MNAGLLFWGGVGESPAVSDSGYNDGNDDDGCVTQIHVGHSALRLAVFSGRDMTART